MSRGFDSFLVTGWSARSSLSSPKPSAGGIWIATARDGRVSTEYHRGRAAAHRRIEALLDAELAAGRRVLAGFDLCFGFPAGFARAVAGRSSALALWDLLADRVEDGEDNRNNRFRVAADLNRAVPGLGPFWGRPRGAEADDLPGRGSLRQGHGLPERREVETRLPGAQPVWKLTGAGAVGSRTLLGLPRLAALRRRFGTRLSAWPFEPEAEIVLAEIHPALVADAVRRAAGPSDIADEVQMRVLARALDEMQARGTLAPALALAGGAHRAEEGWILGVGAEAELAAAARAALGPPRLSNDCFALPPGVHWTPVDEALERLRSRLRPVTGQQEVPLAQGLGRVLAADAKAARANPPAANAAVDGYGFAAASTGDGEQRLPLVPGRAAAGQPLGRPVPPGHAVRVLTGALLPEGVDTVILQEDVTLAADAVAFRGPVRPGANTRRAGEDIARGELALPAGHVLRPPDLALLAAVGLARLPVRARLKVGVLSTGDELAEPDGDAQADRTYDANRPMLLALAARWGHEAVDLGRVRDDRAALTRSMDAAARGAADVVLTSGGASAGDEDHVSALLRESGSLAAWRIALKPGRPLALGMWQGMPVFGLPGNPVAAFVCALIFARPALSAMAGGGWSTPDPVLLPAGFAKRRKPGRREYLRARIGADGRVEVFASEGSGRISGLSWADGLVDLPEDGRDVTPGDTVRYLPYSSFGL
ncbi:MAG: molybdopterin-binding protein [Tranquillimonas sp.]